ncbi:transposase [uncultured Mycobacterium sp.]|uniref:transposase n=1 Tax=uncultured Mycobacterium sp. TaxID=171292 RepID=UPI0035CB4567
MSWKGCRYVTTSSAIVYSSVQVQAAHRVIDGHERVADVARQLDLHESLLQTWVRDERWRMAQAGAAARACCRPNCAPGSADERR